MPTIFAANESSLLVDGQSIEGVQAIEYRVRRDRASVYAVGSAERIAMASGVHDVEGRLRVASSNAVLDGMPGEQSFQIVANLRQGETAVTVSFDECFLIEKSFGLAVGGHGEAVYSFSASRVREER